MTRPLLLAAATLALATAAAGCEPDRWLAGDIAISVRPPFEEPETRVLVVRDLPPPQAAPIDGTPAPPGFDPAQARAAVEGVDVAMCWRPGSTHGVEAARVTFNPTGNVALVEINSSVDGAYFDAACMSRQFGSLRITPHAGAPIAVAANIIAG